VKISLLVWAMWALGVAALDWFANLYDDRPWWGRVGFAVLVATGASLPTAIACAVFQWR